MDKYFELLNRSFDFLIRVEQVYVERFLCLGVMGFAFCQMLFDECQAFLLGLPLHQGAVLCVKPHVLYDGSRGGFEVNAFALLVDVFHVVEEARGSAAAADDYVFR